MVPPSFLLNPAPLPARSYGDERGPENLRAGIAKTFYGGRVTADEVFVSDGSKCDIGRMQMMFGKNTTVAVQVGGREGHIWSRCALVRWPAFFSSSLSPSLSCRTPPTLCTWTRA